MASQIKDKGYNEKLKSAKRKTTPLTLHEVEDVEIAFSEIAFSTCMFTDQ